MKIGSIVNIKNICFRNGEVDHSFNRRRPCIYLGELEDKMCFMPLSNVSSLKHHVKTIIKPTYENGLKKTSHPNLRELIEKPIAYYEEIGIISDDDVIKLFKGITSYYTEVRVPKDKKLLELANNYLKYSPLRYVDDNTQKNKTSRL